MQEPDEEFAARVRRRVAEIEAGTRRPRWERGRRRTRWRFENLVLLGVAVAVVVVVAATIVTRRPSGAAGDPAAPQVSATAIAPTNRPTAASTASTGSGQDDVIPRSWRSRCRVAPSLDPTALRAWVCTLRPALVVEIRRFGSVNEPLAALRRLSGPLRSTDARCRGVVPWSRPPAPRRALGQFACGRGIRGAEVVWSVTGRHLAVRAIAADGDTGRLFDWWDRAAELLATL